MDVLVNFYWLCAVYVLLFCWIGVISENNRVAKREEFP